MDKFTLLLTNFAEKLKKEPESALTVASENVEWLLSVNLPSLAQRLLDDVPAMRDDEGMMKAYIFLMDFIDVVSAEMTNYVTKHQASMRLLLDAAGKDEVTLEAAIVENKERLTDPGFLVYVDSEIEAAASGSPAHDMLCIIRLRLLEVVGEGLSPDVAVLPRLLSQETPEDIVSATRKYLMDFSTPGKDLFLFNLRLLQRDMGKKYGDVDPELVNKMTRIEAAVVALIDEDTRTGGFREEKNELQ